MDSLGSFDCVHRSIDARVGFRVTSSCAFSPLPDQNPREIKAMSIESSVESHREPDPPSFIKKSSAPDLARFLPRFRGQDDKQAAFASTTKTGSLPESSSKDGNDTSVDEADKLQKFYEPIASYEGRHRYDPTAQWTEQEERTLVRRVRSMNAFHKFPTLTTCSLIIKSVLGSASYFLPYSLTVEISPRRCPTTCLVQVNVMLIGVTVIDGIQTT